MKWYCLGCGELTTVHGCIVTTGAENTIRSICRAPLESRRVIEFVPPYHHEEYTSSGIFRPWILPKRESN